MPTAYTADIEKGVTFQQFALVCARAMGALIMMRDDPLDAEIPESFKPSDYHNKELELAKMEMEKLCNMSPAECDSAAKAEFDEAVSYRDKKIADSIALRKKYDAMLEQVRNWVPPSENHVQFKEFMTEQITSSTEFDCITDRDENNVQVLKSGSEWKLERIKKIQWEIDYHTRNHAEELSRTAQRNKWISDLRASLKA